MTEYRHEIAMRWADLDSLNHVNNVVYLEYALQARAAAGIGGPVRRTTIEFRRPILLGRAPVVVTTTVEGHIVRQVIGVDGTPHEFAIVEVELGDPAPAPPVRDGVHRASFALRVTDVDASGAVGPAQVFELFQETRIPYIDTVLTRLQPGGFVVGRIIVEHHRPIAVHDEPLDARAWVSHVGTSSYVIDSQLADEAGVLAASQSVLVGFDLQTQRSRPLTDDERARFTAAHTGALRDG